MKVLIILLSILKFEVSPAHEFKLGYYEIKPTEKNVQLFVRLDREDFLEAIKAECKNHNLLDQCFTDYLSAHFTLVFDGKRAVFKYMDHAFSDDFIEVNIDLGIKANEVKEINVYNDVFLEVYEKQENIVHSLFDGKRRSFRLNRERLETVITY